jgi:site-specific DNA-adenine methylase
MKDFAMRYHGGKGGSGVYQKIINLMPDHRVYIETHFGGGNIFYRKKLAESSIAIDIDAAVTNKIAVLPSITVINCDAISFLKEYQFNGDELIYSDPPYMLETRTKKKIYKYEYTDEQHVDLLTQLCAIGAAGVKVMISGYRCSLYDSMLATFNRIDFNAMTRGGVRTESLWFNFDSASSEKFDKKYLGDNFRERERIKRIQKNMIKKISSMQAAEKKAMLNLIVEVFGIGV